MNRNWIARYYNWADDIIGEEKFYDRSEQEAFNEAMGLMPYDCNDFTVTSLNDNNETNKV